MYNRITLAGNLTRGIELRHSQSGLAIAKTAIATSNKYTVNGEKKEDVCFFDIVFFGNLANVADQYLKKGSRVLIDGRVQFEQWVDQASGERRSKHSVVVETMNILDYKNDSVPHEYVPPRQKYSPPTPRQSETELHASSGNFKEQEDDRDIPF